MYNIVVPNTKILTYFTYLYLKQVPVLVRGDDFNCREFILYIQAFEILAFQFQ